jgi:hypothetical protein
MRLHVSRDPKRADVEFQRLSKTLESLARQGYSPTTITGVGEHLFILLDHERTMQRRLFAPMARYLQLLHEIADDDSDSDTDPAPSPSTEDPVDITAPLSGDSTG